jgi:hypothetical protein
MRISFCMLILLGFVTGAAQAQNVPVYNVTSYSSGSETQKRTIYNNSSNFSAGPISIRNMLSVNQQRTYLDNKRHGGVTPHSFNIQNSGVGSALSLSPAELRAKQQIDQQRAAERARIAKKKREERQAALQQQSNNVNERTSAYRSQFQDEEEQNKSQRVRRSSYQQKSDDSFVPPPVFNRVN